MYLPQATTLPPSIGAQRDLFPCTHLAQESQFEPMVTTFGPVVRPLAALPPHSAAVCRGESRRNLSRIGPGPHSLGVGASRGCYDFSAPKGLSIRYLCGELFKFQCTYLICIYTFCMYLPQATTLPPSIGAQRDLFPCTHLAQESQLEPTVATFGPMLRPLAALPPNSAAVCRGESICNLSRM